MMYFDDVPKFWRYETGPELGPAVYAYLDGREMSARQIELVRLYLGQWIMSPVWDMNPAEDAAIRRKLGSLRNKVALLETRAAIDKWLMDAMKLGMDPL